MPSKGTAADGYGYAHRKLRKDIAAYVDAGFANCWRCGQRIERGSDWDLGHDDDDRSKHKGPEHRACNRATAGRRTDQQPSAPDVDTSRRW